MKAPAAHRAHTSALQEYRKLTHSIRLSLMRWERQHGIPFLYRGISYLDGLRYEAELDKLHQHDKVVQRAKRAF